jgi:NAD-dependent deacetylase sirtuin 2
MQDFPDLVDLVVELDEILPLNSPDLFGIAGYIQRVDPKNIIVLSGAGISTASGIPDFRSEDTGLYHNLPKDLPYPEAVFDIDFFYQNPKPFFTLAKEMITDSFKPTKTHYFIKLLHTKGILLKNFTQNVDVLERKTGLDPEKIVEAHGSFYQGKCVGISNDSPKCSRDYDLDWMKKSLQENGVLQCVECGGHVKPNITFFGEALPERFYDSLQDFSKCDLLIVLGTSLSVAPFASLANLVSADTPRLLINRELVGDFCIVLSPNDSENPDLEQKNDYKQDSSNSINDDENSQDSQEQVLKGRYRDACYLGDVQDGIQELVKLLGWEDELSKVMKEV